jgi:hypothetical protein
MTNPTRRRSPALAITEDDISPAGQGAAAVAAREDKMVLVSIERDFTLTDDNHKPVHYKKGVDEMPLSHAKHWFAINAGGVRLHVPKRVAKTVELAPLEPQTPPKGDPAKILDVSPELRLGLDPSLQQPLH